MHDNHRRALDALAAQLQRAPDMLGLITAGSVAQGRARESSDVDVFLLVTDEAYERRKRNNDLTYFNREVCDYEGGYIDGKIVSLELLQQAEARGSEPTRAAFAGSEVVFSRLPGLQAIVDRIPIYPEGGGQDERCVSALSFGNAACPVRRPNRSCP
ncbi:nucleotidyltransferase domain-containing protein [Cohnella fermenti]|uniref:Nucleotidyltransferase domain-containing protein n=1 Tax=Cohnella fermenti TaxID=2565925 RepID=A0A4S4BYL0_9BACL|nr:nucleotidyltransferase domain-containing protein [Cohnella fermenti]THF80356.1 nucleotidyltransferase domain-containing protein [Cohnella fermenti]